MCPVPSRPATPLLPATAYCCLLLAACCYLLRCCLLPAACCLLAANCCWLLQPPAASCCSLLPLLMPAAAACAAACRRRRPLFPLLFPTSESQFLSARGGGPATRRGQAGCLRPPPGEPPSPRCRRYSKTSCWHQRRRQDQSSSPQARIGERLHATAVEPLSWHKQTRTRLQMPKPGDNRPDLVGS